MIYQYSAKIVRVIDGDTVVVDIDLGLSIWKHNEHIRLEGIAAPELTQAGGKEARDYLKILLPVGTEITLTTKKDRKEKYGRYRGIIRREGGVAGWTGTINEIMVATGHARTSAE